MLTRTGRLSIALLLTGVLTPAMAQTGYDRRAYRRAVDAAIISDIAKDRQAERDARRAPYASPGYGSIRTAQAAREACGAEARRDVGGGAKLLGAPVARTMSTGWEVEGDLDVGDGKGALPFVCSVRNGSVSGVLLGE
ncbi:hypothetical protein WG908_13225 [Sphingobium sp. AN641]|uniref:hypothetical protein n=1 Tax=Sphingobium sp. AN641 TaxID=3133443 RepID=UPI0030BB4844